MAANSTYSTPITVSAVQDLRRHTGRLDADTDERGQ